MARATGIIEASTTSSEPVDDMPLLLTYLKRSGLQQFLDAHYSTWASEDELSLGWLVVLWLAHMLSQSKRHARHLRPWVAAHPATLRRYIGQPVHLADVSDTRLGKALAALGDDMTWHSFEATFNKHVIEHYHLQCERIRVSSLAGQLYVTSEGMLQFDQVRRWWSGAMPLRLLIWHLEPSGLPTTVLPTPLTEQPSLLSAELVSAPRRAIPAQRVVYIGNGDVSAAARAAIASAGDGYLCLLDEQTSKLELDRIQAATPAPLFEIAVDGQREHIADSYEYASQAAANIDEQAPAWNERRMLIRSFAQLQRQSSDLEDRLRTAQSELAALNERKRGKRRPRTLPEMRSTAESILAEHDVVDLLSLSYIETVDTRIVRRYRGRPTMPRAEHMVSVTAELNQHVLAERQRHFGWRAYATNLAPEELSTEGVAHLNFEPHVAVARINGRPLSITSGLAHYPAHLVGLVRLISLALRTMTLIDIVLLSRAVEAGLMSMPPLGGPSQPAQQMLAERLLDAYKDITLTVVNDGYEQHCHVTALSSLQRRMLEMLGLPADTYHVRLSS